LRWPRDTLYPQKLALTSSTCGGRSVDIVRLRTKTTESLPANLLYVGFLTGVRFHAMTKVFLLHIFLKPNFGLPNLCNGHGMLLFGFKANEREFVSHVYLISILQITLTYSRWYGVVHRHRDTLLYDSAGVFYPSERKWKKHIIWITDLGFSFWMQLLVSKPGARSWPITHLCWGYSFIRNSDRRNDRSSTFRSATTP
jgi:hypothetical protein